MASHIFNTLYNVLQRSRIGRIKDDISNIHDENWSVMWEMVSVRIDKSFKKPDCLELFELKMHYELNDMRNQKTSSLGTTFFR